ncbi:hypothetical protein [Lacrimispora saccharolytica]|uniref:Uncharacterized protein n=1 Tax=Lacrimispora saccharolytica (strain ATCC 35040 / DSM 2544 / NRCC 2533 / WM1) TaxID=610130 RepID=D9R5C8_LACSW|nr:hypothetical protein [Lacrimispora saccharolytica]ADL03334.1 hypothetical protein Closa_0708 [[Clostridium] saccharolyticum WM1]QRV18506.1 hypothetical protein I6K70_13230 [Lacrimispora saccharolytica]
MEKKARKEAGRIRRLYSRGKITLNRAREELGLKPIIGGDIKISPISKSINNKKTS